MRYLISKPPLILTLHLKRFEQVYLIDFFKLIFYRLIQIVECQPKNFVDLLNLV